MLYDELGNIDLKTDVGDLNCITAGKPYQLTEIIPNGQINPVYKADELITYTDFNKVDTITTTQYLLKVRYGLGNERLSQKLYSKNGQTQTLISEKTYVAGLAEIVELSDGSSKTINYISSPEGLVAVEIYDEFGLINMNGRVYDPVIARFLSPDGYIQAPGLTQNYNGDIYCLNNPLIYTDPSGELIWLIPNIGWSKNGGLNIGITFMVGIPGVASAQVGVGYSFESNDFTASIGGTAMFNTVYAHYSTQSGFSVGWSAGISPQIGFPISTNFTSVGVNYNISHDSWSGNISAWGVDKNGWDFNPSVSLMIYPEHTTNLLRGQGFRSNSGVFDNMMQGDHSCQEILDYFRFEGTYNPDLKSKRYQSEDYWGATNSETGEISYGNLAFENYSTLYGIYIKESYHAQKIQNGLSLEG